jgi:hypothetical protein
MVMKPIEEMVEFVENLKTETQFEKIEKFFNNLPER